MSVVRDSCFSGGNDVIIYINAQLVLSVTSHKEQSCHKSSVASRHIGLPTTRPH